MRIIQRYICFYDTLPIELFLLKKFVEDVNSTKIFHSNLYQTWRYFVRRILNNEFSDELKILHLSLDCNIFQRNQQSLINEYKINENERIYRIHSLSFLCLPGRQINMIRTGSILQYRNIYSKINHTMIIPFINQLRILIETQTERKYVTSNQFLIFFFFYLILCVIHRVKN